jgi:ACS family tartrate transporter-like MFS transporter
MVDPGSATTARIHFRLILPLTILLFFNSIDRVNISFGALQMNRELGLTPAGYGFGAGIFFVGYILMQAPSIWLLKRCGARRWLFGLVAAWGLCAMAMAVVRTPAQVYAVRALLGVAEAGFAPGVVYLVSIWMPPRYRATAVGGAMMAVPLSIVFGGPLCAWLMTAANPSPMAGWRWMSLSEGVLTLGLALISLWVFTDSPAQAPWLSETQKAWLAGELASEDSAPLPGASGGRGLLIADPRVWLMGAVWFALSGGLYGLVFWLPQVIHQMSGADPLTIAAIAALPWLAMAVGIYANAAHSDRTGERFSHLGGALLLAGLGLVAAATLSSPLLALVCLMIGGLGVGGGQSVFWTLPAALLGRARAADGVPLINMVGSASGLVFPYFIGLIRERSGGFSLPVYALATALFLGVVAVLMLRWLSRPTLSLSPQLQD